MSVTTFYRLCGDEMPEPEPKGWKLGRCWSCQRQHIVCPALAFDQGTGNGPVTLPICPDCVGRAVRHVHQAAMRAVLGAGDERP